MKTQTLSPQSYRLFHLDVEDALRIDHKQHYSQLCATEPSHTINLCLFCLLCKNTHIEGVDADVDFGLTG